MAVYRANVFETQIDKEILVVENSLDAALQTLDRLVEEGSRKGDVPEKAVHPTPEGLVSAFHGKPAQVLGQGPDVGADGHFIVVQDDDQGQSKLPGMGQAFVGQASGEGSIPDDSHRVAFPSADPFGGQQTQSRGYGCG